MGKTPSTQPTSQLSLLQAERPSAQAAPAGAADWVAVARRQVQQGHSPLPALRAAAGSCLSCPWAQDASQTVFGSGPSDAAVVLVGEQPGDQEDRQGLPFVGPAGQLLRDILAEADIDVGACYLTNAVKHFKWTPSGKRRIHQKPAARDVAACRDWLSAELSVLRPRLVVALGLVAAHSLMGKTVRLGEVRGRRLAHERHQNLWVTSHPSAILRMPQPPQQAQARALMVSELRQAHASI